MSCSSCNGCSSSEKRGCGTSSVFNWLAGVDDLKTSKHRNLVEVQFKNNRKGYFENTQNIKLSEGDLVTVEVESGYDVGKINLIGEIVYYQIKRKKINTSTNPLKKIYREAKENEINNYERLIDLETVTVKKAKKIIYKHNLEMKLVDVEYQADNTKAVFYYTAEKRVDFRGLIKDFSKEFKMRIEMKQIGVRQESAMVGGIGSCGRELCCSTWMTEFPPVSTSSARYQQLSINPQKISGQCGKLKCCLNFELDSYLDSLKLFPKSNKTLKTKKGDAKQIKIDVFKRTLQYVYKNNDPGIYEISLAQTLKIIEENKKGNIPESIEEILINKDKIK